jgi:precorrin-6Y C5,15-methyltransferase (decarboxylating)
LQNQVKVRVVGVGPNGETFWRQIVQEGDVIIGGKRILRFFDNINGEKISIGKNLNEVLIGLKEENKKNIVILASGDPLFFGIGKTILTIFKKEEVEFFPYLNSLQLLANKVKIPYEDVVNLSIHGRELDISLFLKSVYNNKKIGVLTDNKNNICRVGEILEKLPFEVEIYLGQMIGTKDENIVKVSAAQLKNISPSSLDTLLIINNDIKEPFFGINDNDFFHEKGLITKREIRVVSLSYLKLKRDSVLWDIGAGSGSLSIEASNFINRGKIFAIEKNPSRIEIIEKNIKKFFAYNVLTVSGNAPEVLEKLPLADRVFIGGNSGGILPILNFLKRVLKKCSIVVLNVVSVDKLSEIIGFCRDNNLPFNSTSMQVGQLKDLSSSYYYKANNMVYIFQIIF